MNKIKKEKKPKLPTDLVSLPVYMVRSKLEAFKEICKAQRLPMTMVAEKEIDKVIAKYSRS